MRLKTIEVTSQRRPFLFKARRHYQGYVEAAVEVKDASIGPRRDNKLASMCALPVWTLSTVCSLYPLTNTTFVKMNKTFAENWGSFVSMQ